LVDGVALIHPTGATLNIRAILALVG